MSDQDFEQKIKPFFWLEHDNSYSVCMADVGNYKTAIFATRADEGFEGSGYDWASLAAVFLEEKHPEWQDIVSFDPEGSMFTAYSSDKGALKAFTLAFKAACEDDKLILDLFSRAELD